MTDTDVHQPEPWFREAGGDDCLHGPEPADDSPDWDAWYERHTGSPQDVRICLDAPIRAACAECPPENGEFPPWPASTAPPRRKDKPMPDQPAIHQSETVTGGSLECLERECEDFFTEDG